MNVRNVMVQLTFFCYILLGVVVALDWAHASWSIFVNNTLCII
jgi:hypothetical protein